MPGMDCVVERAERLRRLQMHVDELILIIMCAAKTYLLFKPDFLKAPGRGEWLALPPKNDLRMLSADAGIERLWLGDASCETL